MDHAEQSAFEPEAAEAEIEAGHYVPHAEVKRWVNSWDKPGDFASPTRPLAEVRWSDPALSDLEAIRAYIAKDDPHAANRVFARLMDAGDNLEILPDRGRARDDGRRELTAVQPQVTVYRHANDIVAILRVRHGARGQQTQTGRS
jgi:plasmid stabilization system protein ParE